MKNNIFFILFCLFAFWVSTAFASGNCFVEASDKSFALFSDDLNGAGIHEALSTSIDYYLSQPPEREYEICGRKFTSKQMAESLQKFDSIYRSVTDSESLKRVLREEFDVCLAAGGDDRDGRILVTGYFEPTVEGSFVRKSPYIYPIYKTPNDLINTDNRTGRIENGRIVPYWSRAEIEENNLLAGHELVYLKDKIEAFILHIQGSGKVRLPDGRFLGLQFAAKNGLPYRSIGKLLVERGVFDLESVSLPSIISYLRDNPEEVNEILYHNKSFVFFRLVENSQGGPLGSLGRMLTPNRSVALDNECFPPGTLAFLASRKPLFGTNDTITGWAPMNRFVFSHDTGSAIRGSGRLDLFTGSGSKARAIAGNQKSAGSLYFLTKKK